MIDPHRPPLVVSQEVHLIHLIEREGEDFVRKQCPVPRLQDLKQWFLHCFCHVRFRRPTGTPLLSLRQTHRRLRFEHEELHCLCTSRQYTEDVFRHRPQCHHGTQPRDSLDLHLVNFIRVHVDSTLRWGTTVNTQKLMTCAVMKILGFFNRCYTINPKCFAKMLCN